ncbi:aerotaxis receptor [Oxalobacteraceae bacterium GrIS 1.11]
MRHNTPVSNKEYEISDSETIVSTTDLQGNIRYANAYFVLVSGFSEQELIGAPQNILRHPDMPAEAFADLWATIKSGRAWTGMVKNRCKNGDFYWVSANVTPIMENGAPTGYMSVRTKPSRQQVAAAAALYRQIKAGNPERIAIDQGDPVPTGLAAKLRGLGKVSLGQRFGWNLGLLIGAVVALACSRLLFDDASGAGRDWLLAGAAAVVANALYFWYDLRASVIVPLKQALQASQTMAGGDLSSEIHTDRKDETGQLLRSLRQLRVNLHSIVGDVRKNFTHIDVATQEIAAGNLDLSGRTESQASALEETASSMEELASTVEQNSGNAARANDMAAAATEVAARGGAIVTQVVTTMGAISAASKKIVDIIGIIEGIAFQTNILALNAAVEAARAGEQGRGFAVVASEVRSLAQRSATAAKEIKDLIGVSVDQVDAGIALADQAGVTMDAILASVRGVSATMHQIAAASHEQSAGIAQVNQAVIQMDEVTQQNAALVEQAAAAASSLQDQTLKVVRALTVFKLSQPRAPALRLAAAPQRALIGVAK